MYIYNLACIIMTRWHSWTTFKKVVNIISLNVVCGPFAYGYKICNNYNSKENIIFHSVVWYS